MDPGSAVGFMRKKKRKIGLSDLKVCNFIKDTALIVLTHLLRHFALETVSSSVPNVCKIVLKYAVS